MPSPRSFRLKLPLALGTALVLAACGVVGPKLDLYDASIAAALPDAAAVSGSKTTPTGNLSPVLVFLGGIDDKSTARAKAARCNFNTPYPLVPGAHELLVAVSVGEPFAYSRYGIARLPVQAAPKSRLTIQGEAYSATAAAIWANDQDGKRITEKLPVELKDNPAKGMPIGFAAIDDTCALP